MLIQRRSKPNSIDLLYQLNELLAFKKIKADDTSPEPEDNEMVQEGAHRPSLIETFTLNSTQEGEEVTNIFKNNRLYNDEALVHRETLISCLKFLARLSRQPLSNPRNQIHIIEASLNLPRGFLVDKLKGFRVVRSIKAV